jgi:hypothetical protein
MHHCPQVVVHVSQDVDERDDSGNNVDIGIIVTMDLPFAQNFPEQLAIMHVEQRFYGFSLCAETFL